MKTLIYLRENSQRPLFSKKLYAAQAAIEE